MGGGIQHGCAHYRGNCASVHRPPKSMNSGIALFAALTWIVISGCQAVAQSSPSQADQLAKYVLANEIKAENQDHSHWMFRLDTKKADSSEEIDEVVETKDG